MVGDLRLEIVRMKTLLAFCILTFALLTPASAHHSFAMFDHTRSVTLKGTVAKFQWTNPHAYIELDVAAPDGKVSHFTIECTSINMLQRQGWRSTAIKAGDKVTAVVSPLIDGQPGGLLLEVTMPDGKVLDPGVPGAQGYKRSDK
jgi:hypothetical protein